EIALVVADGARSSVTLARDGRVTALRALDGPDADTLAAEAAWAIAALGRADRVVVTGAGAARVAERLGTSVDPVRTPGGVALQDGDRDAAAVAIGLAVGNGPAVRFTSGRAVAGGAYRRAAALAATALVVGALDVGL